MIEKTKQLYAGKAKTIFATNDPARVVLHFRDDATAFNGVKKAVLADKGVVNNQFNAFIMQTLQQAGVLTHFEEQLNANESLVKHLEMIPVECVVRNYAAGSLSKRLGIAEGLAFEQPLFEFFYKNDELGDPLMTEDHIRLLHLATDDEITRLKQLTHRVNDILKPLFAAANLLLVDFKLEFGRFDGELYLGDEFTPDGCRVWDKTTQEKLDKDRFRKDLGNVIESYQIIAQKLGIPLTLGEVPKRS